MSERRLRLVLIGDGKMGKAVATLAAERGCDVVALLGVNDITAGVSGEALKGADVAIDFTVPSAAVRNAVSCIKAGCPVVIGTTGWYEELPLLQHAVREYQGKALWSPNFSLGVQLFLAIAEDAAKRISTASAFQAHIVETHHSAKLDAPSGTAIAIAQSVERGLGTTGIATTSVRVGHVPGTHTVLFDAPFEQISLTHEARDRRVFADGAIYAARWLHEAQLSGIYTMRDVINNAHTQKVGEQ